MHDLLVSHEGRPMLEKVGAPFGLGVDEFGLDTMRAAHGDAQ
jgi:hypothetical protein